jgi:hypothetical protein
MSTYKNTSPWANTRLTQDGLGYFKIRPVSAETDDPLYTIESQYIYRPDLLAFDIYGTSKLWWVFTQRNLDILQDPVFDFLPGTTIYLPKPDSLKKVLGL